MGLWGSSGYIFVYFVPLLAVGAHLLGANNIINANGFAIKQIFPELKFAKHIKF